MSVTVGVKVGVAVEVGVAVGEGEGLGVGLSNAFTLPQISGSTEVCGGSVGSEKFLPNSSSQLEQVLRKLHLEKFQFGFHHLQCGQ